MAEILSPVPPGPLPPGMVIRVPSDMTVVSNVGDDVEVAAAWTYPNPLVFSRLMPRTMIDTGQVVTNG